MTPQCFLIFNLGSNMYFKIFNKFLIVFVVSILNLVFTLLPCAVFIY